MVGNYNMEACNRLESPQVHMAMEAPFGRNYHIRVRVRILPRPLGRSRKDNGFRV